MAEWKKVIVSGSSAHLTSLQIDDLVSGVVTGSSDGTLGIQAINGTGNIVATTGASGLEHSGSFSGSFSGDGSALTGISASLIISSLDFGTGLAYTSASYNGSQNITIAVSGAAELSDNAITKWNAADGKFVSSSLTDDGTVVSGASSIQLTGANSVLTGSFSGSFVGTTNLPDLTEGTGIEAFTYDGGAVATVAVSGASSLSSDTITKWTGTAFADTSITDDGALITFGNDALFEGDIIVQGTASFQNTENLLVADRFVLFASGSVAGGDGGIVVQQGTQNVGELFGYENSANRWGFTSSFDATSTSYTPSAFVAAVVDVDGGQSDIAQYQKNGNIKIQSGDIWIYA